MTDPVVCIYGPTASGKTELAMELYQTGRFEIISVDSALVYREMNIGTAKPDAQELAKAPHHLIDILDPDESYSAAGFARDARSLIEEIQARNKIPLLVGGTFLYFRALLDGLAELPQAEPSIRKALEDEAAEFGWPALHDRLKTQDPATAKRLHPNDQQRIQRALEVYELTGKPLSRLLREQKLAHPPIPAHRFALIPEDRAVLHDGIAERFDRMLDAGLVDEVKALLERWNLSADNPSMRSVGYRQVFDFLAGQSDWQQMRERAVIATRQLAKRQFTWLRSETGLICFDPQLKNGATISRAIQTAVL